MTLDEWRFSAQLAWQDLFIRWATIASIAVTLVTSGFVLFKLIPQGLQSGVVTMHYTIYLGIDDVRPWPWVFFIPATLLLVLAVNMCLSFGLYRSDILAARTLTGLATMVILVASIGAFFLVLINL